MFSDNKPPKMVHISDLWVPNCPSSTEPAKNSFSIFSSVARFTVHKCYDNNVMINLSFGTTVAVFYRQCLNDKLEIYRLLYRVSLPYQHFCRH